CSTTRTATRPEPTSAPPNHRRIHTEPKRYQCPDCGKSFRVSTALICHRRIHTKEKPFSCQQCDKHFSSKSNLRHHMKVHWRSPTSSRAEPGPGGPTQAQQQPHTRSEPDQNQT
uniref:C2H2-type domain-containing protein n=1 Tax=Amphiprion percula TaxID=161767 RepID=A0A3P8SER6_AMPPE